MAHEEKILIGDTDVWIELVEPRPGGGARVDVSTDEKTWRVDVTSNGKNDGIVTTWVDGELADLDEPEWLDEVLDRLARAAV